MKDLSFWRARLSATCVLLLALVVPSALGSSKALAQSSSDVSAHVQLAAAKYYGSFAYAIAERVATVATGTTPNDARAAAESVCRQKGGGVDCQAVVWFTDGWASFALGPGNQWGAGVADTSLSAADSTALEYCGNGCQLTMRVGIGGSSFDWGNGAPLRGNWYVGGFTEDVGDHVGRDYWAVDFFSDQTAVYPTRAGKVVFSGYNCETNPPGGKKCYGNVVVVDHGGGLYSTYTHLAATGLPAVGARVTPSTQIGTMSDSGCPPSLCGTPIHMHYAMHIGKPGLTGRLALYDPSLNPVRTPWHKP